MRRYEMMKKIANTLADGEKIKVWISHKGNWNGADVYEITNKGYQWVYHVWKHRGTLMDEYRIRVLGKTLYTMAPINK